MDILNKNACEISRLIRNKEISVVELTIASLERIEKRKDINAFITINSAAVEMAEGVQKRIDSGELDSSIMGVPMVLKDNISTKGIRTTCASKILENYIPPYNATAYERLLEKGAILLGKANMDEFGMGSSTENSFFGATKNPYDKDKVAGGSSGGCCAAVSDNQAFYALGTDTGGSIRQPSSFCGLYGLKPTYGAVSRYGLIAYASSFDTIGPIGRSIEDVKNVFEIIRGVDIRDNTTAEVNINRKKKIRVGVLKTPYKADSDIRLALDRVASRLSEMGFEVQEVEMEYLDYVTEAYYIIAFAQASSNLSRYDGVRYGFRSFEKTLDEMMCASRSEGFGDEVRRRILMGSFVLSSKCYERYYNQAQRVRRLIYNSYKKLFDSVDALILPVSPTTAYNLGEKVNEPLKMYAEDCYCALANLTGAPALAIPCGKNTNGMPVGLQLMGNHFDEGTLFALANALREDGYDE